MISDPIRELAEDFVTVADLAGARIALSDIEIEESLAPHTKPSTLPTGKLAVYVFIHDRRCLKVGKAGAKSKARYCSQHYGLKAPSTLAKSLLKHQARIGVNDLNESNVGNWIIENTRRINFLIPESHGTALISLLESFVQCRLKPEFEGFDSQRTQPEI